MNVCAKPRGSGAPTKSLAWLRESPRRSLTRNPAFIILRSVSKSFRLTAWDCLQVLTKKFSDQQVRMVVECDGRLDESRLAAAVRAAVKAEPILACHVRDGFFRPRWRVIPGFDPESLLRVLRVSDTAGEIARLLDENLDPWRGPVVRIGLVRGEQDTLVVNLDHTVGDAASVRSLTYLLAARYNHPSRTSAPELNAYFAKRGFRSLEPLMPCPDERKSRLAPSGRTGPSWQFPWRLATSEFRKRFLVRRLAPSQAEAVRRFAASQKAWPNDLFLAAYFRALNLLFAGRNAGVPRLTVPIDLRAYLPAAARPRIANFSASFEVALEQGIGASFEDTLKLVREATGKEKQGRPGLRQAAALSSIADRVPFRIIQRRLEHRKIRVALPRPGSLL